MKVLVTGGAGFIGSFLVRHCVDMGSDVLALDIVEPPDCAFQRADFSRCDIRDHAQLSVLLSTFQPDRIYHLAAQSSPALSLAQPRETIDVNVNGTVTLLECLRISKMRSVVVVAGSSAEYGHVASCNLPVVETHALRPLHPYGASKVAQEVVALQYAHTYFMPVVLLRIFNTTGPGKIGDVCSDIIRRAVAIELGLHVPILHIGSLFSRRAIADVRDVVRAIWLSAEKCEAGTAYNVGSETAYSVEEIIETVRPYIATSFTVEQDPALLRSCDETVIVGDVSRFHRCTGWTAAIELRQTLGEMLEWWRFMFASASNPAAFCSE
jgi:GDP-4-dehydro-6-deoxy-D-mannose reductase